MVLFSKSLRICTPVIFYKNLQLIARNKPVFRQIATHSGNVIKNATSTVIITTINITNVTAIAIPGTTNSSSVEITAYSSAIVNISLTVCADKRIISVSFESC